jgi:hypothetical protein
LGRSWNARLPSRTTGAAFHALENTARSKPGIKQQNRQQFPTERQAHDRRPAVTLWAGGVLIMIIAAGITKATEIGVIAESNSTDQGQE